MTNKGPHSNLDRCREQLASFVANTRFGDLAPTELTRSVTQCNDPEASAQYVVCVAASFASVGNAEASRAASKKVDGFLARGLTLDPIWRWHHQNARSVTAFDHRETGPAWLHGLDSLEVAQRLEDPLLMTLSRSNLAYLAIQSGLFHKAHEHLVAAAETPNLPEDVSVGLELMFARVFASWDDLEGSRTHIGAAHRIVSRSPTFRFTRLLVVLAALCIDVGESSWSSAHLSAMYDSVDSSKTGIARSEIQLVHAKLVHSLGFTRDALKRVEVVIEDTSDTGWLKPVALVIKATILSKSGEFRQSLLVLRHEVLVPAPQMRDVQIHSLRRTAYQELGMWKQAADEFEALEASQRRRSVSVQQIHVLQEREQLMAFARAHNEQVRAKNFELEKAIARRKAIMKKSGAEFQGPLAELKSDLDELDGCTDASQGDIVVKRVLITLEELDNVAEELSLLGRNGMDG